MASFGSLPVRALEFPESLLRILSSTQVYFHFAVWDVLRVSRIGRLSEHVELQLSKCQYALLRHTTLHLRYGSDW